MLSVIAGSFTSSLNLNGNKTCIYVFVVVAGCGRAGRGAAPGRGRGGRGGPRGRGGRAGVRRGGEAPRAHAAPPRQKGTVSTNNTTPYLSQYHSDL